MKKLTDSIFLVVLLAVISILAGCGGQIVNITSRPTGADVFSNRDNIGKTPLLTSKDEIMPLWSSDGVFTRAVITLKKPGFKDYKVFVDEFSMPDKIDVTLIPNLVNDENAQLPPSVFDKAKKCQTKGGIWVNDTCQMQID